MSILNSDIDITLGPVHEHCTSVLPRLKWLLDPCSLRQIFGLPEWDAHRWERYEERVEVKHDALQRLAHQKLIDIFTDMNIEQLTGPGIIGELALHDVNIDGVSITSFQSTWADEPSILQTAITFELWKRNRRGQYKTIARVSIQDDFANHKIWKGVARSWMRYSKNGGQFHGRGKWGRLIYQAPTKSR